MGVAVGLLALTGAPAMAENPDFGPGSFTIQFENDRIANTDRHYTHGTRLSRTSEKINHPPDQAAWLPDVINPFDEKGSWRTAIAIGQNIYTPEDTSDPTLIPGDRPYAGWLYTGFSLFNEKRPSTYSNAWDSLNTLELDVGIIGPYTFAEEVQDGVHELINVGRPNGWDNQLKTEPGVNLVYEWKYRHREESAPKEFSVDFLPHAGLSVGNVDTHAKVGGLLRAGYNVPNDFGPPRIRPNVSGPGYVDSIEDIGFYVFAGGEQRIVGRNIFLDGNTFASSHSIDKKRFVRDFQVGTALLFKGVTLAYSLVHRTKEFEGQREPDIFGAFSLSFNL